MSALDRLDRLLKLENDVVSFADGTLFLRQKEKGQLQFDHLLGYRTPSISSIDNFNQNIGDNAKYCIENGIPYCHIVFPAKPVAYRQQFKELGFDITPIYGPLHEKDFVYYPGYESDRSHYLKTDTHCSFLGNHYFMSKVFKNIGSPIDRYTYKLKESMRLGDLAKMRNLAPIEIEEFNGFRELSPTLYTYTIAPVLQGNTGEAYIKINSTAPIKKRLLLFGDSFFAACLGWLSHLIEEIIYVRSPFIMEDVANILEPDIIFSGNAERYLANVPNARKSTPYFINLISLNFDPQKLDPETIKAFHLVFSGRDNPAYQSWKKSLDVESVLAMQNEEDILKLCSQNASLVDRIRDKAISLEAEDLEMAFRYMAIARRARPQGPFIREKFEQYEERLAVSK